MKQNPILGIGLEKERGGALILERGIVRVETAKNCKRIVSENA